MIVLLERDIAGADAPPMKAQDSILPLIRETLDEMKAEQVVEISLAGKSEMADAMVVASGRSSRQVVAIAEKVMEALKQRADVIPRVEGKETGDWVLIDAGDVIVHLFRPEVRDFYQIEKMWTPAAPGAAGRA